MVANENKKKLVNLWTLCGLIRQDCEVIFSAARFHSFVALLLMYVQILFFSNSGPLGLS